MAERIQAYLSSVNRHSGDAGAQGDLYYSAMKTLGQRIKAARDLHGFSQAELGRRVGVKQQTIGELESGASQTTKFLNRLAKALGQDVEWLESGQGVMNKPGASTGYGGASIVQVEGDTYARLPLYDIRAQAGRGALAYDGSPIGWRLFDFNWIKTVSRAPIEQLKVIQVSGDSMEPTLFKGDHVLIDLGNTALAQHGLFVLRMDEALMVKRVQKTFRTGAVRIISDNPRYEVEEITDPDRLSVVGRVVWLGRSVG